MGDEAIPLVAMHVGEQERRDRRNDPWAHAELAGEMWR